MKSSIIEPDDTFSSHYFNHYITPVRFFCDIVTKSGFAGKVLDWIVSQKKAGAPIRRSCLCVNFILFDNM